MVWKLSEHESAANHWPIVIANFHIPCPLHADPIDRIIFNCTAHQAVQYSVLNDHNCEVEFSALNPFTSSSTSIADKTGNFETTEWNRHHCSGTRRIEIQFSDNLSQTANDLYGLILVQNAFQATPPSTIAKLSTGAFPMVSPIYAIMPKLQQLRKLNWTVWIPQSVTIDSKKNIP